MNAKRVIIVGATGAIGRAIAMRCAQRGDRLLCTGRDPDEIERTCADLRHRFGVDAQAQLFDASADDATEFADRCVNTLGGLDGIIFAHGYMAEQNEAERHPELAARTLEVNTIAPVRLTLALAGQLKASKGFACFITSVAGDRGRASNFIYGSSKAALDTFAEGLRQKWRPLGVTVTSVKPGFTDSPMTFGLGGTFLVAPPDRVARDTLAAIDKNRGVVYTPWFWRGIMRIIRSVPRLVYDRVQL